MDGFEEVRGNTMAFNIVGDHIIGTLVSATKMTTPDKYGKKATIYGIKALSGLSHPKNKETKAITEQKVNEGEQWSVFANEALERQMQAVSLGNIVKIQFTETKPSSKGEDAKIKRVYVKKGADGLPVMDQEWVNSQKEFGNFDN